MATPRKIAEYLAATEVEANYRQLAQGFLEQFSLDQLCKGDKEGALVTQIQIRVQDRLQAGVVEKVGRLVGELFTDDDLDQLIAVYNLPLSKKMREAVPLMQRELLNYLGDLDIKHLVEEAMAEFE